eukprot:CAMPEP_0178382644 /NCGR_PEP_ID=MMETSP0689_2-20121128/6597_1 /TAXON_ID=160604 /ORGANISM="Amphidinium massartii, Strain CS-259" /LENGTH=186 /DNA_ID=CAMNT_0020002849 /DNA_START=15 /DNA_END=572 /DNA_ORIENTATION=+
MRILRVSDVALTNHEVYSVVKEELPVHTQRREARAKDQGQDDEMSVERLHSSAVQVIEYFEKCYPFMMKVDTAKANDYLSALKDLLASNGQDLSREELLSIVNLGAGEAFLYSGICDKFEERFPEDGVDKLCDLVRKHLLGQEISSQASAAPIAETSDAPMTDEVKGDEMEADEVQADEMEADETK